MAYRTFSLCCLDVFSTSDYQTFHATSLLPSRSRDILLGWTIAVATNTETYSAAISSDPYSIEVPEESTARVAVSGFEIESCCVSDLLDRPVDSRDLYGEHMLSTTLDHLCCSRHGIANHDQLLRYALSTTFLHTWTLVSWPILVSTTVDIGMPEISRRTVGLDYLS